MYYTTITKKFISSVKLCQSLKIFQKILVNTLSCVDIIFGIGPSQTLNAYLNKVKNLLFCYKIKQKGLNNAFKFFMK